MTHSDVTADTAGDIPKLGPLSSLIDRPEVDAFDTLLEGWADHLRGIPAADRLFYTLSTFGDHGMIYHAIALGRVGLGMDTINDAIELSSSLGVEAALVNGPIKMLFRRVRPQQDSERPRHLRTPKTSSFPSGHASAGMFAATLLTERSRYGPLWFTFGALMGWSRVHVRIHHPSDVVGGTIIGWILGRLALKVLPQIRNR